MNIVTDKHTPNFPKNNPVKNIKYFIILVLEILCGSNIFVCYENNSAEDGFDTDPDPVKDIDPVQRNKNMQRRKKIENYKLSL